MTFPRMTTRHWMIAVAGSSVVFAVFGVTSFVTMVIVALAFSAVITKPVNRQEWLILLIGALAALPWLWLVLLYTFALRAAFFVGHWPYYSHPDPKDLPDRFHPQSEFLEFLIPVIVSVAVISLFALVTRSARSARQPLGISFAVGMAFILASVPIILLILDPAGVMNWIVD